jgi:hypothetical protein
MDANPYFITQEELYVHNFENVLRPFNFSGVGEVTGPLVSELTDDEDIIDVGEETFECQIATGHTIELTPIHNSLFAYPLPPYERTLVTESPMFEITRAPDATQFKTTKSGSEELISPSPITVGISDTYIETFRNQHIVIKDCWIFAELFYSDGTRPRDGAMTIRYGHVKRPDVQMMTYWAISIYEDTKDKPFKIKFTVDYTHNGEHFRETVISRPFTVETRKIMRYRSYLEVSYHSKLRGKASKSHEIVLSTTGIGKKRVEVFVGNDKAEMVITRTNLIVFKTPVIHGLIGRTKRPIVIRYDGRVTPTKLHFEYIGVEEATIVKE